MYKKILLICLIPLSMQTAEAIQLNDSTKNALMHFVGRAFITFYALSAVPSISNSFLSCTSIDTSPQNIQTANKVLAIAAGLTALLHYDLFSSSEEE